MNEGEERKDGRRERRKKMGRRKKRWITLEKKIIGVVKGEKFRSGKKKGEGERWKEEGRQG